MLIVLSPSKTLDFGGRCLTSKVSMPAFLDDSRELIEKLQGLSKPQLGRLMDLSPKLAALNHERYLSWKTPFTPENARPSLLAFKGDVYQGFSLGDYKAADFAFAQKHLRILSGLHGILKPLDLIQPYRLEMGTELRTRRGKDLYAFWGKRIADAINADLDAQRDRILVNLASSEYFRVIDEDRLDARVVTPVFLDFSNGKYRTLSFFFKRARGSMADWIIRNRVKNLSRLAEFDVNGYAFDPDSSTEDKPVFLRKQM